MSNSITVVSRFHHTTNCGKTLEVRLVRNSDKSLTGVVRHVADGKTLDRFTFTILYSQKQLYEAFMLINKAIFIFEDNQHLNLKELL